MTSKTRDLLALGARMAALGITPDDTAALLRASRTLRRWFEHECNGTIQREGDDGEGRPYWTTTGGTRYYTPDREAGARRRIAAILTRYPDLAAYVQSDPRGCALYVYRDHARMGLDADTCYSSIGVGVDA